MKKYLLFALLSCGLFAFNNANAQSFSTQADATNDTVTATYTNTELTLPSYIKGISGSVNIKWHVVTGSTNMNGWASSGICDNHTCYPLVNVLNGSNKVSDAYSTSYGDFHVFLNGANAAVNSCAVVTILMEDTVANYQKTGYVHCCKSPTAIGNVSADDAIRVYPSPAREAVNITFDASMDVHTVAVYNLIGNTVSVFKTTGTSARIDLSDVPAGVYLLRMANSNGQIVATRKFSHL